jgi:hypothetical protein
MFGTFNDSNAPAEQPAAPATETTTEQVEQLDSGETAENTAESESATEESAQEVAASVEDEDDGEEHNERKPKRGFARRIEKFNQKLSAKETEIEYWKQMALRGEQSQPAKVVSPADKPKFADYPDLESYTDALTDWKLQHSLAQVEQRTQLVQTAKTYEQRLEQFKANTPDFDEVMQEFVADYGDIAMPEVVEVAMESDIGPQLAYHLAKNPQEVERLAKLPPRRRYLELGKLEDRLSAPKQTAPVKEVKKFSAAPAPVKPVKGTGKVESNDLSDPNLSYTDWLARRNATLKRK